MSIPFFKHTQVLPSTASYLDASLGDRWYEGRKEYMLVKVGTAAIAAAASQVLIDTYTAGVPTGTVKTTTSAENDDVLGVVPDDIVTIHTTSGTLGAGSYFALQTKGPSLVKANSSAVSGDMLGTSTTAGRAQQFADGTAAGQLTAIQARLRGIFAIARNSTALGTGAGGTIKCDLLGLR